MRKKTVMAAITVFALLLSIAIPVQVGVTKAQPRTLVVPTDYPTIQAAINASSDGDAVFVKSGYYPETLAIAKSIFLVGENRDLTIIDGQRKHSQVILLQADNITVSNFTMGNSGFEPPRNSGSSQQNGEGDGIKIEDKYPYLQNIKIVNNTIVDCPYNGIETGLSYYNSIAGNTIICVTPTFPFPSTFPRGILIECLFSDIENNSFVNVPRSIVFEAESIILGDQKYNVSASNTIKGNQNITLSISPYPFPTPTTEPTPSPSVAEFSNWIMLQLLAVATIVIVYFRRRGKL